jgi:FdrA protein
MSGGTFATEAQVVLEGMVQGVSSNVPTGRSTRLEDVLASQGHSIIDLGSDEFTVGRPHPMIDYSIRKRRIVEESENPDVAVILLDVVIGYGSNPDPAGELVDVLTEAAQRVTVVCSVTGTDQDPQCRRSVESDLEAAGAVVMPTNASASRAAGFIAQGLEKT